MVLESFRAARWVRTFNLIAQAVLFLSLVIGVNLLVQDRGWDQDPLRIDLTRYRRYSLAPETAAYLKSLPNPVRIVVTQTEDAAPADLKGLLREFTYASAANPQGRITAEYLDVDQRPREAQQLGVE